MTIGFHRKSRSPFRDLRTGRTTMKCTIVVLGAILLFPAGLLAQGKPETRKPPPGQTTRAAELPPFCQGDHARNPGESAHPKHGAEWCRQENQGLHGDDGSLPVFMAKMDDGLALEPWCRDGTGHPEFGMMWCQRKEQLRSGGFIDFRTVQDGAFRTLSAPGGFRPSSHAETFCYLGIGHPQFGMEWCTLSQDAWARRQKRARDERVGGVRFVP